MHLIFSQSFLKPSYNIIREVNAWSVTKTCLTVMICLDNLNAIQNFLISRFQYIQWTEEILGLNSTYK